MKGAAFGLHLFFILFLFYICSMKRYGLSLLFFLLCIFPVFSQTQQAVSEHPEITFQSNKIDFGDTLYRKEAVYEYDFVFENTGSAPLVINKVVATCPCVTVPLPEGPIPPGTVDTLKVYFKPNHASKYTQRIMVFTNCPISSSQLYAKGNFLKPSEWKARQTAQEKH